MAPGVGCNSLEQHGSLDSAPGLRVRPLKIASTRPAPHPVPLCACSPRKDDLWSCTCGREWNTFDTGGVCPVCLHQ
jgi:hypothetical protein